MFMLYFLLSANDICKQVDALPFEKSQIIDYIYSLQYIPTDSKDELQVQKAGFLGGPFLNFSMLKSNQATTSKDTIKQPL